jgi:membrane glycosyltransferase
MLKTVQREQVSTETLLMPNQNLQTTFKDDVAPDLDHRIVPSAARRVLFVLPFVFSIMVAAILATAFRSDGQLTLTETVLIALMALLSGWEAIPSTNAIVALFAAQKPLSLKPERNLTIAILATIRNENAKDVIVGKLKLLRLLQRKSRHSFALHVLSDSSSLARIAVERQIIAAALPLPVFHYHRPFNVDFKSGNIRNWIVRHGADYDAFIILDADSELDCATALALANSLAADPACGLIQTVPSVLPGTTRWQQMQSVASCIYGDLQGKGLAAWMGDEANFYGHNAIIRTKAFATCAGLPQLKGRGLWNGTILSHDFVEAALLRRAGWAVRLLPAVSGSFEQAPTDIIAHLKRDARWCLGNFQHSRILWSAGLHTVSRFHLISGILSYVSSAMWLTTLVLWALLDNTQTGVGGDLAASAFVLIFANLLLPRLLGVLHATRHKPYRAWPVAKAALLETLFSSFFAPSLMLQRVKIIGGVFAKRKLTWAPLEKSNRSLLDYCAFHAVEAISGLGLLACLERGFLTPWFLPVAVCLVITPLISWLAAWHVPVDAHEKLNETPPL